MIGPTLILIPTCVERTVVLLTPPPEAIDLLAQTMKRMRDVWREEANPSCEDYKVCAYYKCGSRLSCSQFNRRN